MQRVVIAQRDDLYLDHLKDRFEKNVPTKELKKWDILTTQRRDIVLGLINDGQIRVLVTDAYLAGMPQADCDEVPLAAIEAGIPTILHTSTPKDVSGFIRDKCVAVIDRMGQKPWEQVITAIRDALESRCEA